MSHPPEQQLPPSLFLDPYCDSTLVFWWVCALWPALPHSRLLFIRSPEKVGLCLTSAAPATYRSLWLIHSFLPLCSLKALTRFIVRGDRESKYPGDMSAMLIYERLGNVDGVRMTLCGIPFTHDDLPGH